MAHIVNCIADMDHRSITKPESAVSLSDLRSHPIATAEKLLHWRMQSSTQTQTQPPPQLQPSAPVAEQQKRYQFFPRERQLPILNQNRILDMERATTPTGSRDEKPEKPFASTLRTKISQHSLVRRRKVSVPELGPMTTVQEVPMDSPTIPGRPPLHERSASAPANDGKQNSLAPPFYYPGSTRDSLLARAIEDAFTMGETDETELPQPPSPKQLAPLVIPPSSSKPPQLLSKRSITHMRSGSVPEGYKTSRSGGSPGARQPFTPQSSVPDLTAPTSASTAGTTGGTIPTPISAPPMDSYRASPHPWEGRSTTPVTMERSMTPQPTPTPRSASAQGHRRGGSESSTIMDRGRPRKRGDGRTVSAAPSKRSETSVDKGLEQKAFEELPTGPKPKDAIGNLGAEDITTLQKQAFRQAERFEVLSPEDVESLSKELRRLDERTEYLRRTYTSLRAGRRNLHSRVCQLLRSPRVARFSYESMLKQEEALAELDASIDDWINKLEMAENRRTRVRQKLLEHVAAAAILPAAHGAAAAGEMPHQPSGVPCTPGPCDISTPPRSPTKAPTYFGRTGSSSPSPQRVVAQVPSTILEDPVLDEPADAGEEQTESGPAALKRSEVESIRIYAGDDLYTLLADVENEISKMSENADELNEMPQPTSAGIDQQLKAGEMPTPVAPLEVNTSKDLMSAMPASPPAPTPPMKDFPPRQPSLVSEGTFLLSNAVFKP